MDYLKIIKNACRITFHHKFLWIFGVFTGMGVSVSVSENLNWNFSEENFNALFSKNQNIINYVNQHFGLVIIVIGFLILVALLWFLMSIISQASLIAAVSEEKKGKQVGFVSSFAIGRVRFWPFLGISIFVMLITTFSLIIFAMPFFLAMVYNLQWLIFISGAICLLVSLIFVVLVGIISIFSQRFVVIEKQSFIIAINNAINMIRNNFTIVFVFFLINIIINTAVWLTLVILILFPLVLLILIGVVLYVASTSVFVLYAITFGIAFWAMAMFIIAITNTFNSTLWTLAYLKIKKFKNMKSVSKIK